MGKQIKLPNIDFVKVGNTLVESGKTAGAFVKNHATEFLAGALAGVTIDNIRIRMGRKKDKKAFEENAHKQQHDIVKPKLAPVRPCVRFWRPSRGRATPAKPHTGPVGGV